MTNSTAQRQQQQHRQRGRSRMAYDVAKSQSEKGSYPSQILASTLATRPTNSSRRLTRSSGARPCTAAFSLERCTAMAEDGGKKVAVGGWRCGGHQFAV